MNKFICLQFLTAIIWLKNTDPYLDSCAQPLPSKWAYTITIKKCTHSYRHLHNLKKKIRDHLKNGFVTFTGKKCMSKCMIYGDRLLLHKSNGYKTI